MRLTAGGLLFDGRLSMEGGQIVDVGHRDIQGFTDDVNNLITEDPEVFFGYQIKLAGIVLLQ